MTLPYRGRGHPRRGFERDRAPERVLILPYPFSAVVGMADLSLALLLNAGRGTAYTRTGRVVVDCESGPVRLGLAARLAGALPARYPRLDESSAGGLRAVVVATGRAA